MGKLRKFLALGVLSLGVAVTVTIGVVFPIPPVLLLARRRKIDRIELVQPAPVETRIDLSIPEVPAGMLYR